MPAAKAPGVRDKVVDNKAAVKKVVAVDNSTPTRSWRVSIKTGTGKLRSKNLVPFQALANALRRPTKMVTKRYPNKNSKLR